MNFGYAIKVIDRQLGHLKLKVSYYKWQNKENMIKLTQERINELEKAREMLEWKPCGEGENICNCKNESECGYLEMARLAEEEFKK